MLSKLSYMKRVINEVLPTKKEKKKKRKKKKRSKQMQENGEEDKGKATPTQIHVDKKGVMCVHARCWIQRKGGGGR